MQGKLPIIFLSEINSRKGDHNDEQNNAHYEQYRALVNRELNVWFGGRLGEYKYYDMDAVIAAALDTAEKLNV